MNEREEYGNQDGALWSVSSPCLLHGKYDSMILLYLFGPMVRPLEGAEDRAECGRLQPWDPTTTSQSLDFDYNHVLRGQKVLTKDIFKY